MSVHPANPMPSERERTGGYVVIAAMTILMWLVETIDVAAGDLDNAGIHPRDAEGLTGIAASPFLHAGFGHLIGNTIPFLVLGLAIAVGGLMRTLAVVGIVAVVGGLGTWLTAPSNTVVIGASGLVFGFATYLVARGAYSRTPWHIAGGLVVLVDLRLDPAGRAGPDAGRVVAGAPVRRRRRPRRGARAAPGASGLTRVTCSR